ncbi:MAG: ABC transporter substrate-binding protein [Dehalococcoidia bacterium]
MADKAGAVDKIKGGQYEKVLAASTEELNPAKFAKRGGTIVTRYLDPPHFDPGLSYSCTVYDTHDLASNKAIRAKLGSQADPFKLELEPDLAEKWEQPAADATEVVFSFRKNVKWHNIAPVNGRPFTAEDVKLVWERYAASGVQKDFFSVVDKLEMTDQYTLRAKLKEPYVDFPASVATYGYILPRELYVNSDKVRTEVIGTGPFMRESWTPKEKSVFVRNPDYFEMAGDGKPLPYADKLETLVIEGTAAQKAAFRAGNWVYYAPPNTADAQDVLKSNPDTVWLDLPQSRGGNVNGVTFNLNNARFKDKRVRNAISMGLDRVKYDDLLYDSLNQGYSATSLPWPFVYDQIPTLKDQGPTYQYNPAEAKKLLTAAGQENFEFELVEWYMTAGSNNTLEPMQDMLRQIGLKVVQRKVDNPTAIQLLTQRNYKDAINAVWGPPNYSIDGWIYPWYITNGGLNYIFLSDPELDNLLKAQRKEADANKRRTVLKQIDQRLNDQNYDIWWPQAWYREMWPASLKNYRTHGFVGTMACYSIGQLRSAWIDKG